MSLAELKSVTRILVKAPIKNYSFLGETMAKEDQAKACYLKILRLSEEARKRVQNLLITWSKNWLVQFPKEVNWHTTLF